MPPIEKPLIVGRKAIMAFLQVENWDVVMKLQKEGGLPIGKPAGRWMGKRENLQRWLDQRTNYHDVPENHGQLSGLLERVEALLAKAQQRDRSRSRSKRRNTPVIRRQRRAAKSCNKEV